MSLVRLLTVLTICAMSVGCKLTITVPEGGSVSTGSGNYECAAGETCSIDVLDALFDETFTAVPADGYAFKGWKKAERHFCGNSTDACALSTDGFDAYQELLDVLAGDDEFYLEPEFEQERVGFEILQVVSPNEIRAWIGPDITRAEFDALELPAGWFKNQPREGGEDVAGATSARFLRSPDATEDGDILIEQFFGFNWFHAATIVETGLELDEEGLLSGTRVRKYHELTYEAGSNLILLISPDNEAYFRIGRDANRVTDEPSIPNLWQLVDYTTEEDLVIELFGGNIVIRTDNQDAFQGPVEIGEYGIAEEVPVMAQGPLELRPGLCEDPANMDVLVNSPGWDAELESSKLHPEQVARMLAEPTRGPFHMLNLIKYREQAVYEDGRETDLTGREANALYSPLEFLAAIGASPVFVAAVNEQIEGDEPIWDDVAIVNYPCPIAFFAMAMNPGFQSRLIHKNAGVGETTVMVTHLEPTAPTTDMEPAPSPYPATDKDPAFEFIQVLDFNDFAQYEDDANEPPRTGVNAWQRYQANSSNALIDVGARPTATLRIQGVIVGEDGDWDEAYIVRMPSGAGYEAYAASESVETADYHRKAALADVYSMATEPSLNLLSDQSDADEEPGTLLPVTDTGVGTICTSDADCVGIGFCISDGNGPGFCSRECGAGECGDGYQCCHSCSALFAGLLPFSDSACMVEAAAGQLSAPPLSCSCE